MIELRWKRHSSYPFGSNELVRVGSGWGVLQYREGRLIKNDSPPMGCESEFIKWTDWQTVPVESTEGK